MQAKRPPRYSQGSFLYPDLIDQLDPMDPLLHLGRAIPWKQFEARCAPLYAEREKIRLRRSNRWELRDFLRVIRFQRNKTAKVRNGAYRRVKTIANALLRELERKLSAEDREIQAQKLD